MLKSIVIAYRLAWRLQLFAHIIYSKSWAVTFPLGAFKVHHPGAEQFGRISFGKVLSTPIGGCVFSKLDLYFTPLCHTQHESFKGVSGMSYG